MCRREPVKGAVPPDGGKATVLLGTRVGGRLHPSAIASGVSSNAAATTLPFELTKVSVEVNLHRVAF